MSPVLMQHRLSQKVGETFCLFSLTFVVFKSFLFFSGDDEENPQSDVEATLEQEIETVRRSPEWQRLLQAGRNPDVQKCLKFVAAILPFFILILLKIIFRHIGGKIILNFYV